MTKNRITIDNTTKAIIVSNKVFESLTSAEDTKIARYEARGYVLEIVDDTKKKVSASSKMKDKDIKACLVAGSIELKLNNEQAAAAKELYNKLKNKSFQTAKSFYLELNKVMNGESGKRHDSFDDVVEYYKELVA